MNALAWFATAIVLGSYAHLGRTGRAWPFHVANVVGAAILAPVNLAAGVPAQALLSTTFGALAALALVRQLGRGGHAVCSSRVSNTPASEVEPPTCPHGTPIEHTAAGEVWRPCCAETPPRRPGGELGPPIDGCLSCGGPVLPHCRGRDASRACDLVDCADRVRCRAYGRADGSRWHHRQETP